jgi:hypothetical protein
MGKRKIMIGDVLICPAEQANPYHGSLLGAKRKEALRAFKAGVLSADYAAWYGPSHGGARKVTADEIDWERSGL